MHAAVATLLLVAILPASGRADDEKLLLRLFFHPWDASELRLRSDCSVSSDGGLYLALGWHVFRWPADRPPMFEKLDPAFDAIADPVPPVPTDAYGCPGNPLPVQAIGFDLTAEGTMLPSRDGAAAFVKIVRRFPDQPWQLWVQLHEEVFQVTCDLPTLTPQGLLRCSMAAGSDPNQKRKRSNRYRLHLKATPDVYADPFGNPFYIRCSDHQPPDCQVDYPIHEDVVLAYEFHRKVLRIAKVLNFDRALRSLITAAEVKDFVWR